MNNVKFAQQQEEESFGLFIPGYGIPSRSSRKSRPNFLEEWRKRGKVIPGKIEKESIYKKDKLKMEIFDLFVELFCLDSPLLLKGLLDDVEKSIIIKILSKVEGNQKEAARLLGIKYTTLNEKVKRYKIRFQKSPLASPSRLI